MGWIETADKKIEKIASLLRIDVFHITLVTCRFIIFHEVPLGSAAAAAGDVESRRACVCGAGVVARHTGGGGRQYCCKASWWLTAWAVPHA